MAQQGGNKKSFSSRLMGMKFMQRAAEKKMLGKRKVEQAQEEQDAKEQWGGSGAARGCRVIVEGDPLPERVFGRMSFKNFNPATEKLQQEAQEGPRADAQAAAEGGADEASVTDEQLAETFANRYDKVVPYRDSQPKRRKLR